MEGPRNHERCVRMFENGMTHHFEGTFGRERRRHTVNADGSISNRVIHIKNGEKLVYNFNQSDLHVCKFSRLSHTGCKLKSRLCEGVGT